MERAVNAGGINEDFDGALQGAFLTADLDVEYYDFNNIYDSCNLPAYVKSDDLSDIEFA